MKKAEVVEQIKSVYARVQALADGLNASQLDWEPAPGQWSMKDHIAHLGFWDRNFANLFKTALKLEPREVLAGTLDEINARAYVDNHERPALEVLAELEQARDILIGAVELFSDEDLSETGRFEVAKEQPLGDYIVHEVNGHFAGHTAELQQLRAQAIAAHP